MEYRSFSDLNNAVRNWQYQLPKDYDLIVGIPRSGLLVANMLSIYLNLPMTDVDGLIENRLLDAGKQLKKNKIFPDLSKKNKILVVDDSVLYGKQLNIIKNKLNKKNLPHQIEYGAVYMSPKSTKHVDYWYELVEPPRMFEWNMMHHKYLSKCCVDIDGVLCRDPFRYENDDGEQYLRFISNVEPLVVPSSEIGWLVTSRLEKYRSLTEAWLKKHNIKYKKLVMLNLSHRGSRRLSRTHAILHKSTVYRESAAYLFIESSKYQAGEIAKMTGKPVFCIESRTMIQPGKLKRSISSSKYFIMDLKRDPVNAIVCLTKSFIRQSGYFVLKIYAMITRRSAV